MPGIVASCIVSVAVVVTISVSKCSLHYHDSRNSNLSRCVGFLLVACYMNVVSLSLLSSLIAVSQMARARRLRDAPSTCRRRFGHRRKPQRDGYVAACHLPDGRAARGGRALGTARGARAGQPDARAGLAGGRRQEPVRKVGPAVCRQARRPLVLNVSAWCFVFGGLVLGRVGGI